MLLEDERSNECCYEKSTKKAHNRIWALHCGDANKTLMGTKFHIPSVHCKKRRFAFLQIQKLDAANLEMLRIIALRITITS